MEPTNKIFEDVKSVCQIMEDDNSFDSEIFLHINSAISRVGQLMDISPDFRFTKTSTWEDMIGIKMSRTNLFGSVAGFISIRVKNVFDPGNGPTVQFHERFLEQEAESIQIAYQEFKRKNKDPFKVDDALRLEIQRQEHLDNLRNRKL